VCVRDLTFVKGYMGGLEVNELDRVVRILLGFSSVSVITSPGGYGLPVTF
jgi:hypothetical protein